MKSSKNLLVIAYYFPPMGTVAFLRNYHISKYLSKLFNSSHLITIKNISIPLKDEILNDFIKEHRVYNFDYRNLGNLLSSKNSNIRDTTNAKSSSWQVRFIRKFLDSFPTNIFFGEGGFLYIINGTLRGIRLIKKKNITHIYSSFRPISDHIIAYNLKRIFPYLKWTADFRDPPVDSNEQSVFYKKSQWWFINKLISKSNTIITVSDGVTGLFLDVNPNTKTIKNGIYNLFKEMSINKYSKFTLSFTGSIYPNFQKPEILFNSIKELLEKKIINKNNFQLVYSGKDSLIWDNLIKSCSIESISINKGEISLYDSIKTQKQSHINVLFSWSNEMSRGVLTGKLFEYLATGNPIFSFINGEQDKEFEAIFKNINAGFVFYNNDTEKLTKIIHQFFNQWKNNGKIQFSLNKKALESYNWESRIKELKILTID